MGIKKFERIGVPTVGEAGEGFIISANVLDYMESCDIIDIVEYDHYGRYIVTDVYGETGYFYTQEEA